MFNAALIKRAGHRVASFAYKTFAHSQSRYLFLLCAFSFPGALATWAISLSLFKSRTAFEKAVQNLLSIEKRNFTFLGMALRCRAI